MNGSSAARTSTQRRRKEENKGRIKGDKVDARRCAVELKLTLRSIPHATATFGANRRDLRPGDCTACAISGSEIARKV
eukprot:629260-Rhodomonas_salina.2